MSSVSGFSGVYAVEWAQTAPGDEWGLPPDLMAVGMSWRWRGDARRLDAGTATLWLDAPADRDDPRRRARDRMRRLALATIPQTQADADPESPPDSMLLTDGRRVYPARIVRQGARLLAVFHPLLPPPGRELWVAALTLGDSSPRARRAGVICFLPGTMIATPKGPRAIESLVPGDPVQTRDNGPQPVVWRGETRLSGAELYLHPHLRPLRIRSGALASGQPDGDLLVSPGHRLLMRAPGALGGAEVLVAAEDLEDGRAIRRDFGIDSVRYVHLMLDRHEIITANGQPCESFHPGLADSRVLAWHARSIERVVPGLIGDPSRFGDPARRCLSRGEAGILTAMAD